MSSQPPIGAISHIRSAPGVPVIRNVNWGGLKTLYVKEVKRFFKVQLQTVWAPAITTLLFLVIFTVATGARRPVMVGTGTVAFADFIAPGLIIMGMMQNAYANSSFSLLVGKIQGTIVDYLMPPLSVAELLAALVGGAVTRALCVGAAVWLAMTLWPGVHVTPHAPLAILWFGLLGSVFLAFVGGADIDLGGKVRPCRRGAEFHRRAAHIAVGYILFGRPSRARVSRVQPRQSVFLHHLGLSLRLSRHQRFAGDDRRDRGCSASTSRSGCSATRCSSAGGN